MSELRAPDPTLTVYDGDGAVLLDGGLPVRQAHRPEHLGLMTWTVCRVPPSETTWMDPDDARWFAIPCRECFPDAPPPGADGPCCGNPEDCPRGGWFRDPSLAWQTTAALTERP